MVIFPLLQIFVYAYMIYSNPGLPMLTLSMYLAWTFAGFVDAFGEGMTASITKMNLKIRTLDVSSREKFTEEDEKKAYANYYIFRFLVRNVCQFGSGFYAETLSLGFFVIGLGMVSVFMIIIAIFYYEEDRVKIRIS